MHTEDNGAGVHVLDGSAGVCAMRERRNQMYQNLTLIQFVCTTKDLAVGNSNQQLNPVHHLSDFSTVALQL